jgi:hypothetical protein
LQAKWRGRSSGRGGIGRSDFEALADTGIFPAPECDRMLPSNADELVRRRRDYGRLQPLDLRHQRGQPVIGAGKAGKAAPGDVCCVR